MTVGELIEVLKALPRDLGVYLQVDDDERYEVMDAKQHRDTDGSVLVVLTW